MGRWSPSSFVGSAGDVVFPWKEGHLAGFGKELKELVKQKRLLAFLWIGHLTWMSWAAYSNFFTIHLEALGMSKAFAGWAWALGVVSEVGLMFRWREIASRFPSRRILSFALILIAVRWALYSVLKSPAAILRFSSSMESVSLPSIFPPWPSWTRSLLRA